MIVSLYTASLVALGGAVGALSRFSLTRLCQTLLGEQWPYGTLFVNVLGSLLIGFVAELSLQRFGIAVERQISALIITGFFGALTTFSSFSLETMNLFQRGELGLALLNIGLNVCLCLLAVFSGYYLAKLF